MSTAMTAKDTLDREFLNARAMILSLGASLDRIGRSNGTVKEDAQLHQLYKGIQVLKMDTDNRAEQVQLLFSRLYDETWKEKFEL